MGDATVTTSTSYIKSICVLILNGLSIRQLTLKDKPGTVFANVDKSHVETKTSDELILHSIALALIHNRHTRKMYYHPWVTTYYRKWRPNTNLDQD